MDASERKVKVVMLPWLAHGHVSPFLELAKRLAKRNFHIYFCSTPVILNSIKEKINKIQSLSIQLTEFHLPSLPNLPPHHHTTNGLPCHLMPILKDAQDMASPNFAAILDNLKPDLVIYDGNQYWAPTMASSLSIRAVEFITSSASMMGFALHMMKDPTAPFPYSEIMPRDFKDFVSRVHDRSSMEDQIKERYRYMESIRRSDFILIKSFRELEGKYIDSFSEVSEKKVVTVGPLVEGPVGDGDGSSEIMEWLDGKGGALSVWVSFGSECFLTKEEIDEVAKGLELSNVNFIWAIRFAKGEKLTLAKALPEGFLDRVGEKGKVVEGWAPQMKILAHPSIGGFVSHCGWGSIMESLSMGVPIIPVPMHLDQPFNARILEVTGVGVEVGRGGNGGLEGVEIARAIRKVVAEKGGEDIRRKAKEFGDIIRLRDETEIDNVVVELLKLLKKGPK